MTGAVPGGTSPSPFRVGSGPPGPGRARLLPVTIVFVIAVLMVMNGALWWLSRRFLGELDLELGRRLQAVAVIAARGLDGELAAGAPPDSGLADELRELLEENELSNVTLLAPDETTILDVRRFSRPGERNPTLDLYLVPVTRALAGEPDVSAQYRVGASYLKSAFAPVHDAAGEVVAALSVEAGASFFDAVRDVRRSLWVVAGLSLLAVAGLAVGFVSTAARQGRLLASLQRADTLATMGQMTAMLAHEIRNPLGIIKGAAERLRDRYDLGADEISAFIPEEVDRLNAILANYLEFAREESDTSGRFVPVELLEGVRRLVEAQFARDGVRLELVADTGSREERRGDAARLRQALLNLVLNAAQAMPEGGVIRLSSRVGADRLRLSVEDEGPGLSDEARRRLGTPFHTTKATGSGLGLTIVQRVAEAHRGSLFAENLGRGGARFTLDLPARAGGEPTDAKGTG